jgi:Bacterial PH domain
MSSYKSLHLDTDENVIFEVRKHWIVFAGAVTAFVVSVFLPIIAYLVSIQMFPDYASYFSGFYFHLFLFFYTLWFLFCWVNFFLSWTKYFLDVWYVTGKRIIDIEQEKIFYRVVSNLRFDKIQDITVEVNGFLATTLNYGNIRVQTASENERDFYMATVRDPDGVKKIIFAQHNIVGDREE